MRTQLDCIEPVLYMIEYFIQGKVVSQMEFRTQVNASFNLFKIKAADQQLSASDIEEAQYALVALIDEMVLNSEVIWKEEWLQSSLQQQYFHVHNAGVGFFEHLYELRKTPFENQFVFEVYYLCLELGFKGKYLTLENEKRLLLITELKTKVSSMQGSVVDYLISEKLIVKKIEYKDNRRKWSGVSNTTMIVCSLIVVVLMFLFAHWPLRLQ